MTVDIERAINTLTPVKLIQQFVDPHLAIRLINVITLLVTKRQLYFPSSYPTLTVCYTLAFSQGDTLLAILFKLNIPF